MSPVEDWESYKKADGEMVMRRNAYAEMQLI
jgi:hypothetical protein